MTTYRDARERAKRYPPGTWVRFMQQGHLVIGEVAYVEFPMSGSFHLITDAGTVGEDHILESRTKTEE